jgi:hypothetical protein
MRSKRSGPLYFKGLALHPAFWKRAEAFWAERPTSTLSRAALLAPPTQISAQLAAEEDLGIFARDPRAWG